MHGELKSDNIRQGDSLPSVVKRVIQEDINRYAEASGDFNPIHIDEAFAAQTPFGGTIIHGMLILAYMSEMMTTAFGNSWLSTGKLSVRFKAPGRPKDTITVSGKVDSIERQDGSSYANCSIEACNQSGEALITGEAKVTLSA